MNHRMNVIRKTAAAVSAAALAALVAAPTAQAAPGARTLYAAPDGHGTTCTVARPCSPEGARDRARTETGRDIRILLKGGTYHLDAPLRLGAEDSGADGHTVTWTAAPGARPILSGGRVISGWTQNADGTWTADAPAGVTPRQLFVDGRRAVRARGEACAASVCDATKTGMSGAKATGIADWQRPTDAAAVIRVRWRNYHCRIAGVSGDLLTFDQPCWTNSASGTNRTGPAWDTTTVDSTRYSGVAFFENAPELLDQPGEFVWNSEARTVTYLPRKGENMNRAQALTRTPNSCSSSTVPTTSSSAGSASRMRRTADPTPKRATRVCRPVSP